MRLSVHLFVYCILFVLVSSCRTDPPVGNNTIPGGNTNSVLFPDERFLVPLHQIKFGEIKSGGKILKSVGLDRVKPISTDIIDEVDELKVETENLKKLVMEKCK